MSTALQTLPHALALIIPMAFIASAVLGSSHQINWKFPQKLCFYILGLIAILALALGLGLMSPTTPFWWGFSPLSLAMLALNALMALILSKFSSTYLQGELNESQYYRALMLTFAAITTVLLSQHLLLILLGWICISLGLHRLLLFYPNRPRACLGAHKKFLMARCAELCLFLAFLLLHHLHGTWLLNEINQDLSLGKFQPEHHLVAILIALAAIIKCAQMPVHGWLMQVMEAPTTVSALLHAGIVNLGGYILIIFAPLMMWSTSARWFLLMIAGFSTLLASLVMMTRISIKVRLAWSTCAQMGLMLMECALGLFDLALLHLFAHSLYKAYAFLNSGSTVEVDILKRMAPAQTIPLKSWRKPMLWGSILTFTWMLLWGESHHISTWFLFAMALIVFFAHAQEHALWENNYSFIFYGMIFLALYSFQKWVFGHLVENGESLGGLANLWVMFLFSLLALGYLILRFSPENAVLQRWRATLFAGFYLDEWATRWTLIIWPTTMPELHAEKYRSLRGLSK